MTGNIKYEGVIPATLRRYCDRHRHQIAAVAAGGGYATDSGFAYDVMLRDGWCDGSDPFGSCHTLIEATLKEILSALRGIRQCECDDCLKAKGEMKCPHCGKVIPRNDLLAAAGRALATKRTTRTGGRPRTDAPRCPCGKMTAKLATIRKHECGPTSTVPK